MQLSNYILNVPITQIEVKRAKAVNLESEQVNRQIVGERIAFIERRGKYLNLHTNNGQRLLLALKEVVLYFMAKQKTIQIVYLMLKFNSKITILFTLPVHVKGCSMCILPKKQALN